MNEGATYLTSEGMKKLQDELNTLKNEKRDEIATRLRIAIEQGDISENADYSAAKEDQAFVEGRIQELERLLAHVKVIDNLDRQHGVVSIGSTVELLEEGEEETEEYQIVGTQEANPFENRISFVSPIGSAIYNKREGETVTVDTPGGKIQMKIVKVK